MSTPQASRGATWFSALSGIAADDAGFRGPVILSYDFGAEERRFRALSERDPALSYCPDYADADTIREGVRRIGEVVAEQVALYGTLTGEERPAPRRPAPKPAPPKEPAEPKGPAEPAEGARVVPMRRRAG